MTLNNRYSSKLDFLRQNSFECICYLFVVSLFLSRALLAFSGAFLLLSAIYNHQTQKTELQLTTPKKIFIFIYAVFFIHTLLNPIHIENALDVLFKNLTFLVLPLAFMFQEKISKKVTVNILKLFFWLSMICVSTNTLYALINYSQFLQDVANSKNINSIIGPQHQELGVFSCIALVFGAFLVKNTRDKKVKFTYIALIILMIIELHFIAYRFTIFALYGLLFLFGSVVIFRKKNFKLTLIATLAVILFAFSLSQIPSVKTRYDNTLDDFKTIIENRNPNYQSTTQRILAIKCAFEIIKKHPWWGVNVMEARNEMQEQYKLNSYLLIPENRIFIHNQFIYYILCFGIPLGLILTVAIFYLVLKNFKKHPLIFWSFLPLLLHMMIENTLEKQITANAFIFLFLMLTQPKNTINNEDSGFHIY